MDKNKITYLSRSFDTLDLAILLDTLFHCGIRGNPLKLISSFLRNRQQFVEFRKTKSSILQISTVRNTKSSILLISTGVPQGSILGLLLFFLIYINDFPSASSYFNFIMYADDTTLYSNVDSPNQTNNSNKIRLTEKKSNAEFAKIDE